MKSSSRTCSVAGVAVLLATVTACSFQPVHNADVVSDPGEADAGRTAQPPTEALDPAPGDGPEAVPAVDASPPSTDRPVDSAEDRPIPPSPDASAPSPPSPSPDTAPPPPPLPPPCQLRPPSAVFDATPAGTCGNVCNTARALVADGVSAGLDCTGGGTVQIDAVHVTACIGADFGVPINLDPLVVRMRSVASACGTACTGPTCGTGHTALVFHGRERGSYEFATEVPITPNFRDYSVTLGIAARYVLICRTGAGARRDDLSLDSILSHASCR